MAKLPKRKPKPEPSLQWQEKTSPVELLPKDGENAEVYLKRLNTVESTKHAARDVRVKRAIIAAEMMGEIWKARVIDHPSQYGDISEDLKLALDNLRQIIDIGNTPLNDLMQKTAYNMHTQQLGKRNLKKLETILSPKVDAASKEQIDSAEKRIAHLLQNNSSLLPDQLIDTLADKLIEMHSLAGVKK